MAPLFFISLVCFFMALTCIPSSSRTSPKADRLLWTIYRIFPVGPSPLSPAASSSPTVHAKGAASTEPVKSCLLRCKNGRNKNCHYVYYLFTTSKSMSLSLFCNQINDRCSIYLSTYSFWHLVPSGNVPQGRRASLLASSINKSFIYSSTLSFHLTNGLPLLLGSIIPLA